MKKSVNLWTDCLPSSIDMEETRQFLNGFGFDARICGELFGQGVCGEDAVCSMAAFFAGVRIKDFEAPLERPSVPSSFEIEEEISRMRKKTADPSVAYDGLWFQRKLHATLAVPSRSEVFASLVYTGRLLCTYGEKRYHTRVAVMGAMSGAVQIISVPGVVEGPAKPPEYYWAKGRLFQEGFAAEGQSRALRVLDEVFDGRFVKPSDVLMGRIISAYGLQPLLYILTGKRFCKNPDCSLFNSHRQSEVLNAQARALVCKDCLKSFERGAG